MKKAVKSKSKKSGKRTLTITEENDYQRLWPTLREDWVHHDLSSMTGLAFMSSEKPFTTDRYKPIGKVFCDGIGVRLGSLPKEDAISAKNSIVNAIHGKVPNLRIKHIKITERNENTYAWLTLKPETANLTPHMSTELVNIVKVIKEHLMITWDLDEDELDEIKMIKLDITQDLYGSFIPKWKGKAFPSIKAHLQAAITMMFTSGLPNLLSLGRIWDLKVVRGQNILDTCYQYFVNNQRRKRILCVKIYDKMMDLLSRED